MKERIKKFYSDHENEIVRIGYYTAGCVVTAIVMNHMFKMRDMDMKKAIDASLEATGEYAYLSPDGVTKYILTKTRV